MARLLDDIFKNCVDLNDGTLHLFSTNNEISRCDTEIKKIMDDFHKSLKNKELEGQFLDFCEALDDAYANRDAVITQVLVTRGMALTIQLTTEILTSK